MKSGGDLPCKELRRSSGAEEYSILKNTGFLMVGNMGQRFLSFFSSILITRYLGPDQYGQFTFVMAFVTIIAVFWDFGLNTLLVRDVSRDKLLTSEYSGNVIALKTLLLVLIFPIMFVYLQYTQQSGTIIRSVAIFSLGIFVYGLSGVFEGIFSAWKRLDYSALLNVLRAVMLLVLLLIVVHMEGGLLEIVFCYFVSFVGVFVASLVILNRSFVLPSFRSLRVATMLDLIRNAVPYLMTSVVSIILFKIDHLMLAKMSGNVQLGLYGASYTLYEIIISFFPMMIMRSSFPVLCERYHADLLGMVGLYKRLLTTLLLIGLPISCGTLLLGREIIVALYGTDYAAAGPLMLVLGGAIWVFFITNLTGWTLAAMNKQPLVLFSGMMAMVANVLLNLLLIPRMGAVGSATATVLCEVMQLVFMAIIIRKSLAVRFEATHAKILINTVVMGLAIIVLKQFTFYNDIIKLAMIVIIAMFLYIMISILWRIFRYDEMKQLLHAW